jgi:hypothetical protein
MDETLETQQLRRYFASIILGGLAGAASIIAAVIADLKWECWRWNRGCYDGQGGVVLVVLVPAMFVIGSLLGCLWTWLKTKLPPSSILAQNYAGAGNLQERIIRATLPIGLRLLICLGLFLLLIFLG